MTTMVPPTHGYARDLEQGRAGVSVVRYHGTILSGTRGVDFDVMVRSGIFPVFFYSVFRYLFFFPFLKLFMLCKSPLLYISSLYFLA